MGTGKRKLDGSNRGHPLNWPVNKDIYKSRGEGIITPFSLGLDGEVWHHDRFLFVPITPGGNKGFIVVSHERIDDLFWVVSDKYWHPAEGALMAAAIVTELIDEYKKEVALAQYP